MKMTEERKKLQDKLRRKFKWSTNTDYGRGTILIKPDASRCHYYTPEHPTDLAINFNNFEIHRNSLHNNGHDIEIIMTKFEARDDGDYREAGCLRSYITMEELELIYKIAKEKQVENMSY